MNRLQWKASVLICSILIFYSVPAVESAPEEIKNILSLLTEHGVQMQHVGNSARSVGKAIQSMGKAAASKVRMLNVLTGWDKSETPVPISEKPDAASNKPPAISKRTVTKVISDGVNSVYRTVANVAAAKINFFRNLTGWNKSENPVANATKPLANTRKPVNYSQRPVTYLEEQHTYREEPVNNMHEPANNMHEPVNNMHEPGNHMQEPANNSEEHYLKF